MLDFAACQFIKLSLAILCIFICILPSCLSVGIWELLLFILLLLLLLPWDVIEGFDRSFLMCLCPAEEDDEVEEPPLGREPSLGCLWEPPFLTGLDWRLCMWAVCAWWGHCVWVGCVCSWFLTPLRNCLGVCEWQGWEWWMGVDLAVGWAGNQQKNRHLHWETQ